MNEKANLRKFLESWRGKKFTDAESESFDITKLIGVPCLLSVIHKVSKSGNTYAEISGVNLLPKGMTCPEQITPSQMLSYTAWDEGLFQSLPDFIKSKIVTSQEYRAMKQPYTIEDTTATDDDDTLPF
jgi:hypothetical protein